MHAGGRAWPGLVIDVDATLAAAHSEKESAAPTFKGGYGFHPVLAFLDNTSEALAGILRPGNAGANNATDHITVTDLALAQIPDHERHGHVRDTGTRESTTGLRSQGVAWSSPAGPGGGVEKRSGEGLRAGPVVLIATPGLATDAPDEGSGLARRGQSRLQHMSGSRGWPWPLGTVA